VVPVRTKADAHECGHPYGILRHPIAALPHSITSTAIYARKFESCIHAEKQLSLKRIYYFRTSMSAVRGPVRASPSYPSARPRALALLWCKCCKGAANAAGPSPPPIGPPSAVAPGCIPTDSQYLPSVPRHGCRARLPRQFHQTQQHSSFFRRLQRRQSGHTCRC